MFRYHLGLGSNQGDRHGILRRALASLRGLGRIAAVSSVYETAPVGFEDQPEFLNLVVSLETDLAPDALFGRTRSIEEAEGRSRSFRNAPRTLDIDILTLERRSEDGGWRPSAVVHPGLSVPHRRMTGRAFVLVPLLEVAADLRDPVTGRSYASYLEAVGADGVDRVMDGRSLLEGIDGAETTRG